MTAGSAASAEVAARASAAAAPITIRFIWFPCSLSIAPSGSASPSGKPAIVIRPGVPAFRQNPRLAQLCTADRNFHALFEQMDKIPRGAIFAFPEPALLTITGGKASHAGEENGETGGTGPHRPRSDEE